MRECYQITVYISRSWQPRNTEVVAATWVIHCYSSHTWRNCETKEKNRWALTSPFLLFWECLEFHPAKWAVWDCWEALLWLPLSSIHLLFWRQWRKSVKTVFGGTIPALLKDELSSRLPFNSNSNNYWGLYEAEAHGRTCFYNEHLQWVYTMNIYNEFSDT